MAQVQLQTTTNHGNKGVHTAVQRGNNVWDISTYLTHKGYATTVWVTTPTTVARVRALEPGAVATTTENAIVQHTNTVMRVLAHANAGQ